MTKLKSVLVVVIALLVVATAAAQQKLNITGKWVFEVQTDAGTGTPTVTFKQDGEKITGHYSSMTLGEADLTGTLKGQALTFNFQADLQGQAVPVTYTATVDSNTTMKGTIDIGGAATGTFTGKKQ
jgi:phage gp45-like